MGLFSKDVEGGLLLQQLSLQAAATCGGRQILPCEPGAHVAGCRRVMAESAAGAQASPHACKHTQVRANVRHTHTENTGLKPPWYTTRQTNQTAEWQKPKSMQTRLHARQCNGDYVKKIVLEDNQECQILARHSGLRHWKQKLVEFLSKSTKVRILFPGHHRPTPSRPWWNHLGRTSSFAGIKYSLFSVSLGPLTSYNRAGYTTA